MPPTIHEEKKRQLFYKCENCDKAFITPYKLQRHSYSHSGLRPFQCSICVKSFSQSCNLKTHIKNTHSEVFTDVYSLPLLKILHQPYLDKKTKNKVNKDNKCGSCGKSFSRGRHLKRHIHAVHEGHKDFKCESCDKSFAEAWYLKKHIHTVHEGQKDYKFEDNGLLPYKCEECYKSFITPSKLQRHSFSHSGLQPYQCNICAKSFSQSANLKTHIKNTHSEDLIMLYPIILETDPLPLQEPSLDFRTINDGNKDHKCEFPCKGHKGYNCESCGISFYQPDRLRKHIQTVHHVH